MMSNHCISWHFKTYQLHVYVRKRKEDIRMTFSRLLSTPSNVPLESAYSELTGGLGTKAFTGSSTTTTSLPSWLSETYFY